MIYWYHVYIVCHVCGDTLRAADNIKYLHMNIMNIAELNLFWLVYTSIAANNFES